MKHLPLYCALFTLLTFMACKDTQSGSEYFDSLSFKTSTEHVDTSAEYYLSGYFTLNGNTLPVYSVTMEKDLNGNFAFAYSCAVDTTNMSYSSIIENNNVLGNGYSELEISFVDHCPGCQFQAVVQAGAQSFNTKSDSISGLSITLRHYVDSDHSTYTNTQSNEIQPADAYFDVTRITPVNKPYVQYEIEARFNNIMLWDYQGNTAQLHYFVLKAPIYPPDSLVNTAPCM